MSSGQHKIIKRQSDGSFTSHDQIIHFSSGNVRTIKGVRWIWEDEMTHLVNENDVEFLINKQNVDFVQRRVEYKNAR